MPTRTSGLFPFMVLWIMVSPNAKIQAEDAISVQLVQIDPMASNSSKTVVEVKNIPSNILDLIRNRSVDSPLWEKGIYLKVHSENSKGLESRPAIGGGWKVEKNSLKFYPKYNLQEGLEYSLAYNLEALAKPEQEVKTFRSILFKLPKTKTGTRSKVVAVYPTAKSLPENQLKFYIHFSQSMSKGEAYERIHLLDEDGAIIPKAFLELSEELWDPEYKRFTLLIDPGRIKNGLKPREELGPVLVSGKRYTLRIDAKWEDAKGNPLLDKYEKGFSVDSADHNPPDPKNWKVSLPLNKTAPLQIEFPEPMDHSLLERVVWVVDAEGKKIEGKIEISQYEMIWKFTPKSAWENGNYRIWCETILEDLAGNRIGKKFEVELKPERVGVANEVETIEVPFEIDWKEKNK